MKGETRKRGEILISRKRRKNENTEKKNKDGVKKMETGYKKKTVTS